MSGPRICRIAYRDRSPDAALAAAVGRLRALGIQPGGLLQHGHAGNSARCATLFLEDIATGRRVKIFEERGLQARGCRLDPSGLAVAAGWLQEAIARRPDVLFINRFGRQEADGRGLRDEIGAAVVAEIPLVIPVNDALMPSWRVFAGEEMQQVDAEAGAIANWLMNHEAPADAKAVA